MKAVGREPAALRAAMEPAQSALQMMSTNTALSANRLHVANCHIKIADCLLTLLRVFFQPVLDELKLHLKRADNVLGEMRLELRAQDRVQAVQQQADFARVTFGLVTQLTRIGTSTHQMAMQVQTLLDSTRPPSEARHDDTFLRAMWNWTQRSKSRAISDSIALIARLPRQLVNSAQEDPEAATLLSSFQSIDAATCRDAQQRCAMSARRERLLNEMRLNPRTQKIEKLLRARAVELDELHIAVKERGIFSKYNGVLLVDWYQYTNTLNVSEWHCLLVRLDAQAVTLKHVPVTKSTKTPEEWIDEFLEKPKRDHPRRGEEEVITAVSSDAAKISLNQLEPYVKPLQALLADEDLVVLCPSGSLHRLPLHAIEFTRQHGGTQACLIETNTVVYTHSLTVFKQCISRESAKTSEKVKKVRAVLPLTAEGETDQRGYDDEDPNTPGVDASQPASVRQLIAALRENMSAKVVTKGQANLDKLRSSLSRYNITMFLGHVHDTPERPLSSHLCLYEQVPHTNCKTELETESRNTWSAEDFLANSSLRLGCLLILIACASGTPAVLPGNEFLGIVPAALCAGAQSVVSTLWPIARQRGIQFLRQISRRWAEQEPLDVIDVAECARNAVLDVKNSSPGLASWAGFVYHGSPFYDV